jgi:hypothetical protein
MVDYLQQNYQYSLRAGSRLRSDPVSWFLFEGGRGHCEYFAGSMVILMRSLGVPARMVGGYAGGALDGGGGELTVRQSAAHTWVEVWLGPERGWQAFDPTPAEGVPSLSNLSGLDRLLWLWERAQAVWDGRVLTFSLGEQIELLGGLLDGGSALLDRLRWVHLLWLVVALIVVVGAVRSKPLVRALWRKLRAERRPPAAGVVDRVVRRLEAQGVEVSPAATPRTLADLAGRRWPGAAGPLAELLPLVEAELYAPSAGETRTAARQLWPRLRQAMRDSGGPRPASSGRGV